MKIARIVCCLCLYLFISVPVFAHPTATENGEFCTSIRNKQGATLSYRLDELFRKGCLGGEKDTDDLSLWVHKQRAAELRERKAVARGILVTLEEKLSAIAADADDEYRLLLENLQNSVLAISKSELKVDKYLQTPHYTYSPLKGRVGRWLPVRQTILTQSCAAETTITDACEQRFASAQTAIRYATLAAETIEYLRKTEGLEYLERLQLIDQQWELYATEARSQFFWELLLNGRRYQKTLDDNQKNSVSKRLLTPPPSNQVILAHPTVALEYVGNAGSGSKFAPSLMVEWIGFNRWVWSESNSKEEESGQLVSNAKMKNAWGGSFVSSLSDRNGTSNLRHGAVVHYDNRYSFGATYGDGDFGVFISLDLMELVTSKTKKIEEVKEKIRLNGLP